MKKFDRTQQERFLTLRELGYNITEACRSVGGMSYKTLESIYKRAEAGDEDLQEFVRRHEEIKEGKQMQSLSKNELVRLLEHEARNGSIQAMRLLLERPWERMAKEEKSSPPKSSFIDQLAAKRNSKG